MDNHTRINKFFKMAKGEMLRYIVDLCLRYLRIGTIWAMAMNTFGAIFDRPWVDISAVLTFIALWACTELGASLLKRLFAKDRKEETNEYSEEVYES